MKTKKPKKRAETRGNGVFVMQFLWMPKNKTPWIAIEK
jgi:hypothetical protein